MSCAYKWLAQAESHWKGRTIKMQTGAYRFCLLAQMDGPPLGATIGADEYIAHEAPHALHWSVAAAFIILALAVFLHVESLSLRRASEPKGAIGLLPPFFPYLCAALMFMFWAHHLFKQAHLSYSTNGSAFGAAFDYALFEDPSHFVGLFVSASALLFSVALYNFWFALSAYGVLGSNTDHRLGKKTAVGIGLSFMGIAADIATLWSFFRVT